MDFSPRHSLPIELIFGMSDCLEPHEYSGFPCTCQCAVTPVSRKLDKPMDQEELWSGLDLNSSQAI